MISAAMLWLARLGDCAMPQPINATTTTAASTAMERSNLRTVLRLPVQRDLVALAAKDTVVARGLDTRRAARAVEFEGMRRWANASPRYHARVLPLRAARRSSPYRYAVFQSDSPRVSLGVY